MKPGLVLPARPPSFGCYRSRMSCRLATVWVLPLLLLMVLRGSPPR
jgi:hypothetical protein